MGTVVPSGWGFRSLFSGGEGAAYPKAADTTFIFGYKLT